MSGNDQTEYDAGNPEHVAQQGKTRKALRDQELDDLKFVLETRQGRRALWRILEQFGIHRNSFNGDPGWSAFNEGKRNAALWIEAEILKADENSLLMMMKENRSER